MFNAGAEFIGEKVKAEETAAGSERITILNLNLFLLRNHLNPLSETRLILHFSSAGAQNTRTQRESERERNLRRLTAESVATLVKKKVHL